MIALNVKSFLNQADELDVPELPYPYVYSDKAIMKLFLYALIHAIHGSKTLHRHLEERPDVLRLVGLDFSPSQDDLEQTLQNDARNRSPGPEAGASALDRRGA
jgi:hypothetical protein